MSTFTAFYHDDEDCFFISQETDLTNIEDDFEVVDFAEATDEKSFVFVDSKKVTQQDVSAFISEMISTSADFLALLNQSTIPEIKTGMVACGIIDADEVTYMRFMDNVSAFKNAASTFAYLHSNPFIPTGLGGEFYAWLEKMRLIAVRVGIIKDHGSIYSYVGQAIAGTKLASAFATELLKISIAIGKGKLAKQFSK